MKSDYKILNRKFSPHKVYLDDQDKEQTVGLMFKDVAKFGNREVAMVHQKF